MYLIALLIESFKDQIDKAMLYQVYVELLQSINFN